MGRAQVLGLLVVILAGCAASAPRSVTAVPRSRPPPGSVEPLVQQALVRLRQCGSGSGACAILLQRRQGTRVAAVERRLREELAKESRFVWSTASEQHDGPVPDPGQPGGHVDAVSWRFDPPPQLVLLINEHEGRAVIVGRLPENDPLGPPTAAGWAWTVEE